MIKVSVRELLHNFVSYKEKAKAGERIVVCEHQKPILDITPHEEKVAKPVWKRSHFRLKDDRVSFTGICLKMRRQERA
jgi:antitoxin (DNA-binding transcriptional repressor) of toxin-antitoxin stability system